MNTVHNIPPQQLPFKQKNKEWRKKNIDWVDDRSFANNNLIRNNVIHKKINYDLLLGKLHRSDLELVLNPNNINAGYIPENIVHYPIMNSKLNVLRGEECARIFDYKVIVTNPNSISQIEEDKQKAVLERLQEMVKNTAQSEEDFNKELEKVNDYFSYSYKDMREARANCLLNHYVKEYNMPLMFNGGFIDAMVVGEEIYQCDIVGGEPVIERLNPLKTHIFKSGYSNKIEDADIIVIEDYWSPGKITDVYYDEFAKLSSADRKKVKELLDITSNGYDSADSMDNIDERDGFINAKFIGDEGITDKYYFDPTGLFSDSSIDTSLPYDIAGNVRVLRVYWKSRRKIKKVKSYNPETGEEEYNFYPETYVLNKDLGEEETIYWINEAWEGTKIGNDIYIGMRPRVIQYNRLSNPSRCHFGIVGSIYNINDNRPFSLVDMMKSYNYLYDVIFDRLNKHLAKNWGKIIQMDFAKVPKGWDVDKWLYYAKTMNIAVVDSFKEGEIGVATGKLAGSLNNASSGVIDAEMGNIIQQQVNFLEFIKMEMADIIGISKQREGQVSNRETVGGVERATLQSSHITEWLFMIHDDVKKRALECFLETAKIALRGQSKKFQYLLSTNALQIVDIDGDEFAENDYGLVVDNSRGIQELGQKIDMLAQAALQNQALNFSTMMKLYSSCSLAEKIRMIETYEQRSQEQAQQQAEQEKQLQQQQMQQNAQQEQVKLEQEMQIARDKNDTSIIVAQINSQAEADRLALMNHDEEYTEKDKAALQENMRQFDAKIRLDMQRLEFEKQKHKEDNELKDKISKRQAAKKL